MADSTTTTDRPRPLDAYAVWRTMSGALLTVTLIAFASLFAAGAFSVLLTVGGVAGLFWLRRWSAAPGLLLAAMAFVLAFGGDALGAFVGSAPLPTLLLLSFTVLGFATTHLRAVQVHRRLSEAPEPHGAEADAARPTAPLGQAVVVALAPALFVVAAGVVAGVVEQQRDADAAAGLGLDPNLYALLVLVWLAGVGTLLVQGGFALWRRFDADPVEQTLYLNDLVWRDQRREMDHLAGQIARDRRKRRKDGGAAAMVE